MYINIIELLECIKEACHKTECESCPFSGTYSHKGEDSDFYYCKIAGTPNYWQIDSGADAEVLCDIRDFERYYNMKGEKKNGQ